KQGYKHMSREYKVTRKLQKQRSSYIITLPKLWVKSLGLEQGEDMSVVFNGIVKIIPPSLEQETTSKEVA
ncbi:MAG: AbrB/MazE/SpoVT family DNA-binding domain-containing protein, partial [Candidatus Hodarchaeota archaeon]